MNEFQIPCANKPISLFVDCKTVSPTTVRVMAFNPNRPKTFYTNRIKTVSGIGQFEVRMPQSCDNVILKLVSNDRNLEVKTPVAKDLNQFTNCFRGDKKVMSFINFAQEFSERCSILAPGTYYSDDKQFRIDYMNEITQDGKVLSTPARISNIDGLMQVSKKMFTEYTVPMRMAILLHEFSHFNLNVVQKDEIEADLNALKIYLGLGYPVIEAHQSFLNVFKKSPSNQNFERYQYIKTFIDNFDNLKYKICL